MNRRPLQGLASIVRFNWHFFVVALVGIALLMAGSHYSAPPYSWVFLAMAGAGVLLVCISLAATVYAYDLGGIYSLSWLEPCMVGAASAANIHAGFDETSALLKLRHPGMKWHILDFYDPSKHTAISIKRARAVHAPHPQTVPVSSAQLPLEPGSVDRVVLLLAAHEIRDPGERVAFFCEIRRVLVDDGRVVVTEHLRDWPNLFAFSFGAWHFHSRREWLSTFSGAGFRIERELKNNLLVTTFILEKAWNHI